MHTDLPPSPWLLRWMHLIAPGGRVLDVACGHGRHSHALARAGFAVTAVDRDPVALAHTQAHWPEGAPAGQLIEADLEGAPWPLPHLQGQWDAVVVTHYLWRPLWPTLLAALAPGGLYLHETFARGQETVGRPSRPEFLLAPGELLAVCSGLRIVAFEDGFEHAPDRFVQRIAAVRPAQPTSMPLTPARYPLTPHERSPTAT